MYQPPPSTPTSPFPRLTMAVVSAEKVPFLRAAGRPPLATLARTPPSKPSGMDAAQWQAGQLGTPGFARPIRGGGAGTSTAGGRSLAADYLLLPRCDRGSRAHLPGRAGKARTLFTPPTPRSEVPPVKSPPFPGKLWGRRIERPSGFVWSRGNNSGTRCAFLPRSNPLRICAYTKL